MSDTKPDDYAALCKRLKYRAGLQMLPADTLLDEEAADAIERQTAEIARLSRRLPDWDGKSTLRQLTDRAEAAESQVRQLQDAALGEWKRTHGELTDAARCQMPAYVVGLEKRLAACERDARRYQLVRTYDGVAIDELIQFIDPGPCGHLCS